MSALTNSLTDSVNHGVVEVFENQKRVEEAARALNETSSKFRERSQAWATAESEAKQPQVSRRDLSEKITLCHIWRLDLKGKILQSGAGAEKSERYVESGPPGHRSCPGRAPRF